MPSPGRRWVLLCYTLLFALFSTAQAAHVHRTPGPEKQAHFQSAGLSSQADDEQLCPLCTAAHSALPAVQPVVVGQLLVVAQMVPGAPREVAAEPWHFAQFSRPPPTLFQA